MPQGSPPIGDFHAHKGLVHIRTMRARASRQAQQLRQVQANSHRKPVRIARYSRHRFVYVYLIIIRKFIANSHVEK